MITLIGHGFVGQRIAKHLDDFEWISHKDIPSANTDFVINATGYIGFPNVDAGENNKQLGLQANVLYPLSLERIVDVPILHISSGCVYTGYPETGWKEDDTPNFTFDNGSFYSGCKGLFQELFEQYKNKSYLFRIRLPFDHTMDNRNLLYKYDNYEKLVDYKNSITGVEDLVNCVNLFVKQRPTPGVYNVCNTGTTTTKKIVQKLGLTDKQWISHSEFEKLVISPRSNCSLNTDKISSVYLMPDVDTALDKAVSLYKQQC